MPVHGQMLPAMVTMLLAFPMTWPNAFDTVPVDLALHIFNLRGADCKAVKALSGFYSLAYKIFQT